MPKLYRTIDRVQLQIECSGCGDPVRSSGETLAEAQRKMIDSGLVEDGSDIAHCLNCLGDRRPAGVVEEVSEEDLDLDDEVPE